jgi:hypothetical protein
LELNLKLGSNTGARGEAVMKATAANVPEQKCHAGVAPTERFASYSDYGGGQLVSLEVGLCAAVLGIL